MKVPAIPQREVERQRALDATGLLDTPPDPEFDEITQVVAATLRAPVALVSLVDRDRQWFKSRHGLDARETARSTSFCGHVVADDASLIVCDALRDERFSDNPFVIGAPHVAFYAGAPLRSSSGFALGTLCVIDHVPRALSEHERNFLEVMARQVSRLIELRVRVRVQESEIQSFAEQASIASLVAAEDGTISWATHRACALLGLAENALRGQTLAALFADHDEHARFCRLLEERGGVSNLPVVLRGGRGATQTVHIDAAYRGAGALGRYARLTLTDPAQSADRDTVLEGFRQMFELSSDLVCIANGHLFFEQLNPAWQRVVGWTRAELSSRPALSFVHPDDVALVESTARAMFEHRTSVSDFELRFRCADGSYRHLSWAATVVDERLVATARDVTEQVKARQRVEVKSRVLRAIAIAQADFIATGVASPEWWRAVLESIVDATESEYGFVATIEPDELGLTSRARAIVDRARDRAVVGSEAASASVDGLLASLRDGPLTARSRDALPERSLPEGHPELRAFLALPCGAGESLVAVVGLANRRDGYDAALVDDLATVGLFIESVLNQLASAAERSAAEARLNAVINSTMDGIITIDEEGTIFSVNAAVERLFGYSNRDVVGQHFTIFMQAETRDRHSEYLLQFVANSDAVMAPRGREVLGVRSDGSTVPLEVSISEFVLSETRYFTVILRDISKRVDAEQALRETASQLSNALQIARAGHWEYDVARDRFRFNDNFYRIFRTTMEQEGGYEMSSAQYALRFVHPEDSMIVASEIQEALRAGDSEYSRHLEHRFLYSDGTVGHLAVHFFARTTPNGEITHFYGVNQDITERRQRDLDREAIEQERRLNQELADKIAELDRSQALAALTSQCVELVQRCVSLSEGVEVIARFIERMFPDGNVSLYTQSPTSEELALRAHYERSASDPPPAILDAASCWALRTRRVYGVWSGGIHLPCAHCSGAGHAVSLCGPLLCLDRVYGVLSVTLPSMRSGELNEASVKGTMAQFEAVVQSLSGALSSISLRESLQRLALVDELTGLPNRRAFSTAAQRMLSRRRRTGEPITVAMFDIDHFKKINDTFGHEEGDRVLQRIASELTSFFRAEDVIGRLGGEEFAVVLAGIAPADAERRLDAFRQNVRDRCVLRGAPITVSAGYVHSDIVAIESLEQALRDADTALYAAKRAGRDRVVRALSVVA